MDLNLIKRKRDQKSKNNRIPKTATLLIRKKVAMLKSESQKYKNVFLQIEQRERPSLKQTLDP